MAAHRPNEFRYARRIMSFMNQRAQVPMIIGITHGDCQGAWQEENIAVALGFLDESKRPLIIKVNANESASVAQAIIALVQQLRQTTLV
ncbi:MAG: hypothetical protein WA896_01275 [Spirulinaceae cyanobacterium]